MIAQRILSVVMAQLALSCADEVNKLARTQVTLRVSASNEVRTRLGSLRVHVRYLRVATSTCPSLVTALTRTR